MCRKDTVMRERPFKKPTAPDRRARRYPVQGGGLDKRFRLMITRLDTGEMTHGTPVVLNAEGMLAECDHLFPLDTEVTINALANEGASALRFSVRAWVVYHIDGRAAFQFDAMDDATRQAVRGIVHLFHAGRGEIVDHKL